MDKTYSAVGLIEKDFLRHAFWSPTISCGFHESTQNFSLPAFSLRLWLVSGDKTSK